MKKTGISIYKLLCGITISMLIFQNEANCKTLPETVLVDTVQEDGKLTVLSMQNDLNILWSAIKTLHPAYGKYTTKPALRKAFKSTYTSINIPLSESEFIDRLYPFLCQLHCGHTQIHHSENYKPLSTDLAEPHLPFEVLVSNHHAYITHYKDSSLHTGDEIISINKVRVSAIIDHGYELYCGDGYIESFKELFLSEYNGFEDACFKYFRWTGPYQIEIKTNNGILKQVVVGPSKTSGPWHSSIIKTPVPQTVWITDQTIQDSLLRFTANGTAYFKINTFQYSDTTIYEKAFHRIRLSETKNLILDLRHNTGGDIRIATTLLSYLADHNFNIIKTVQTQLKNPTDHGFKSYFDADISEAFHTGFQTNASSDGWFQVNSKTAFGKIYGPFDTAAKDHYNGRLWVLIDGATFSSAALFSAALKEQCRQAQFVGRETAGAMEGCNGLTLQRLTLPYSKINIDFPLARLTSLANNYQKGRGIIPDYPVTYTAKDIVDGKDLDLQRAWSLLSNQ